MPDSTDNAKVTRIERGDYLAELLQSNNKAEPFWYYVLQRKDSPEILHLDKYETFEEAIEAANLALARLKSAV